MDGREGTACPGGFSAVLIRAKTVSSRAPAKFSLPEGGVIG
ncbi:hypothetical protein [Desulfosporosinus sp. BG]|nr:hypothetical protein [Desulfosporosinus sp. BG]ODA39941.1 hypothetical protein DSBG_3315 [Desulfosporosinus sp. BG]